MWHIDEATLGSDPSGSLCGIEKWWYLLLQVESDELSFTYPELLTDDNPVTEYFSETECTIYHKMIRDRNGI